MTRVVVSVHLNSTYQTVDIGQRTSTLPSQTARTPPLSTFPTTCEGHCFFARPASPRAPPRYRKQGATEAKPPTTSLGLEGYGQAGRYAPNGNGSHARDFAPLPPHRPMQSLMLGIRQD